MSVNQISGDLTAAHPEAADRWASAIKPRAANTFDLGGVEKVDSVGVSMLINWKRFAQANDATLSFVNLPEQIMRLVEMYELEDLLLDQQKTASDSEAKTAEPAAAAA
ncbi:MAG: STAS domain-containing protein [Betaproteobacteria bacterium]|nr:STAS domain-containing protein [Betaproteobacteria bacterium]